MTDLMLPVFIQVAITFVIITLLPGARVAWLKANRDKYKQAAGDNSLYEGRARLLTNSLTNQFETPVLFYAVVAFAMITGHAGGWMVWLAWIYAASRIVHTLIHLGPNNVRLRFIVFLISVVTLLAMWLLLFCRIYLQS